MGYGDQRYRHVILYDQYGNPIDTTNPIPVRNTSFISDDNSSTTLLPGDTGGSDHIFTGVSEELTNVAAIFINIFTDQDSATEGLSIQQSSDGTNWDHTDEYSIFANSGKNYNINPNSKYFRIIYTNGTVTQTEFRLQTIFKSIYSTPSSHRLGSNIKDDDDAQLVKSVINVQTNDDNTYANVDVQNPLPSDGDSVYGKDLLLDECDEGGFTITTNPTADSRTILTSMVSDVWIEKKDATATNPKVVTLAFKRPILTSSFGIDSGPTGTFSNTKIYVKQSQEEFLVTDESADNTKHKIRLFPIAPLKFSEIRFEFHTTDTITTGLYGIFKHTEVAARLQGIDPDGVIQDVKVTPDGNLLISDNSSGLAIARGDVTDTSNVSKFGQNADIGTAAYEDIWDVGGVYPYPTNGTAPITHIDSDDALDTEPLEVQGLDITGALTVQTKTLTGTTPVELDTPLWRVFRMKNMGTSDFVGDVQAINTADTVIYAQIQDGNNQTLMALYTIPLGKTGYLQQGTNSLIGSNRDYTISGRMMMRPYGGVFQLKRTFGLQSDGTSYMIMPFPVPGRIPALTDIKVSAISSSAGGGLNTTFELVLIDD